MRGEKLSKFRFELETVGHPEGNLICSSLYSSCGNMEDGEGISLEFGKQGSWVVSFKDLESLYHMARMTREQQGKYAR